MDKYKILNVSNTATSSEIKKAYHRLAMKYHPDKNKEPGAEEKFKEISGAYNVLIDKEKRSLYDRFGDEGLKSGMMPDPFGGMFGGIFGQRHQQQPPDRSRDRIEKIKVSLADIYNNKKIKINLNKIIKCSLCKGSGGKYDHSIKKCGLCKGVGRYMKLTQIAPGMLQQTHQICDKCNGTGKIIKEVCIKCQGKRVEKLTKNIEVTIGNGIDNNDRITIYGEANDNPDCSTTGDLILIIQQQDDAVFTRDKSNLFMKQGILLSEALSGVKFIIEHMDGRKIFIEHNGIITPGMKKKIEGEGLTNKEGCRGDLIIEFVINFPSVLSAERKKYLKKLLPRNKEEVSGEGCEKDTLVDIDPDLHNSNSQSNPQSNHQSNHQPEMFEEFVPPGMNCAQQ